MFLFLRTFSLANIFPLGIIEKRDCIVCIVCILYSFLFSAAGMNREEGEQFRIFDFDFILIAVDSRIRRLSFGLRWQRKR
jgi:hypothetical protein